MNTESIKALNDSHVINTYGERKLALVRGEGARLWDAEGNEYLDFFAGIAVCNLGHCHPAVTEAICAQAGMLVHVSNLYYLEPQARLAEKLSSLSFADRWFFCNGGAEANEAAIKLARRYHVVKGAPKPEIITAEQSFHGRTLATITATGQPKYHQGFAPLPPGFRYVPFNDLKALKKAVTPETGAIMLEPIQGEGGVRTPDPGYLRGVRKLCDRHGILLILDEVQTGLGRTGTLFAHEADHIRPDIMTLAKGLANGAPIGAMGCTAEAAQGFSIGSHACTFGGNPLCAAAALATLEVITKKKLAEKARDNGAYFMGKLVDLALDYSGMIKEVRGRGLMIGVECAKPVAPLIAKMLEKGIICGPAGPNVLRFLPPLIVTKRDINRVLKALRASLEESAC
jgi:acetylornithine/N-succinyldiaminopimelate aminotransferase